MIPERQHRNITPGTGDIQTFMDCPDRKETDLVAVCKMNWWGKLSCDSLRHVGDCPRGYA